MEAEAMSVFIAHNDEPGKPFREHRVTDPDRWETECGVRFDFNEEDTFLLTGYIEHEREDVTVCEECFPPVLPLPLPNDRLTLDEGGPVTVVASVYYRDDIGALLVLRPTAPYFEVGHYYLADTEVEPGSFGTFVPARKQGYWHYLGHAENIVPAVRLYEESGGDY